MNEELLSLWDAQELGFKVVEMADRVRVMDSACPGAEAKSGFKIDGVHYELVVRVSKKQSEPEFGA